MCHCINDNARWVNGVCNIGQQLLDLIDAAGGKEKIPLRK